MKPRCSNLVVFALCAMLVETSYADWPALRGPTGSGTLTAGGILTRSRDVQLKVRWKQDLGSGYSSVSIAQDRAVTLFSESDGDVMACFSLTDGARLWQVRIGDRFIGKDGSFDGPMSTPAIHDGTVFGLSAQGRLVAANLADGQVLWEKELTSDFAAPQPHYGFSTSPIVVGDMLIVQGGMGIETESGAPAVMSPMMGPSSRTIGLDPTTGAKKWDCGTDAVAHQSPIPVILGGRQLILAAGNEKLFGIDPVTGSLAFEYEHGGSGPRGSMSMMPVHLGEGNVMLCHEDQSSKLVHIAHSETGFKVQEIWKSPAICNSYGVPVFLNGQIYGRNNRIMSCVDPATGRALWKSREPADGFQLAVDGHLIVADKAGVLHLGRVDSTGYQEIAATKVVDDLVWAIPSFSKDAVYLRSLGEIARIDIVPKTETVSTDAEANSPLGERFSAALAAIAEQSSPAGKAQAIDELLAEFGGHSPIIEGDTAHFIYRGAAKDVALGCDLFGSRQDRTMIRVPGTDLFYLAAKLPMTQRLSYVYFVDYKPTTDPLNEKTFTSSIYVDGMEVGLGMPDTTPLEMSWFAMPQWRKPSFEPAESLGGEIVAHPFKSELFDEEIPIEVYLPAAYAADSDRRLPTIYVHDGGAARTIGKLAEVADGLMRDGRIPPAIIVFINRPFSPMARMDGYQDVIAKELAPSVDKAFRTLAERSARFNYGAGAGSMLALMTAATTADDFGGVAAQTPFLMGDVETMVVGALSGISQPTKCYLDWGRFDLFNPHENWDMRTSAQKTFETLQANEHLSLSGGMVDDSTDWPSWQSRLDRVFSALLIDE